MKYRIFFDMKNGETVASVFESHQDIMDISKGVKDKELYILETCNRKGETPDLIIRTSEISSVRLYKG